MDLEEILKRIDFLEDERRKDKKTIKALEERLSSIEGVDRQYLQSINHMEGEITRIDTLLSKFDQIESSISNLRQDLTKQVEKFSKEAKSREKEFEKRTQSDLDTMDSTMKKIRVDMEQIQEVKRGLEVRKEEGYRITTLIDELSKKFDDVLHEREESQRSVRVIEEGRRQDMKRITEIQGEVSAYKKRLEEARAKTDMTADTVRKTELKVKEIQDAELDRRQAQTKFIESQNRLLVERERIWKDWEQRFDTIARQTTNLDSQIQSMDATNRAVKRAQEQFDDVSKRFDRRVNEISEMQRLIEERFRQEWLTFQADDQKRWTNYMLSQNEIQNEYNRQHGKINERLIKIEDLTQEITDILNQSSSDSEKRILEMIDFLQEWKESQDQMHIR
jgi:chromosome segregation ATPase